MTPLAALPVAVPFLAAAVLVATGSLTPRWSNDSLGTAAAVAAMAICVVLAHEAGSHAIVYWLGGLRRHDGVSLGIALQIDPLAAGVAAFAALMVVAAFMYSLRYFDAVKGLFHALMLLFLMGMVGFCLTGDVFDLVVFFELTNVVAYALTAYRIEERAPIQGAINFAITNSISGYAMMIGVALLYARTGGLNMAPIGAALDGHPADALVIVAMVLLFLGFLTKLAIVPLHFWLADAQAVAPVPVCVLFSSVMVALGLYGLARTYWVIFAGVMTPHAQALSTILVAAGAVTVIVSCWMCFLQRHIKRLLAFATMSHMGLALCGVGLLDPRALSGVVVYLAAHGLTAGALFMLCGTLLHRFRTVDEFDLHGRGRIGGRVRLVGILFAAGALLLSALPPLMMLQGQAQIERAAGADGYGWLASLFVLAAATTGGAVLRVTGRIFLGWGPAQAAHPDQARAAEERVDETRAEPDHTPPLMVAVPAVLLALAAALSFVPGALRWVARAARLFADHRAYAAWVMHSARVPLPQAHYPQASLLELLLGVGGVVLALALAALGLFGRPLRAAIPGAVTGRSQAVVISVRRLHSGHVGDYVAWWTTGAAAFGVACLLWLR